MHVGFLHFKSARCPQIEGNATEIHGEKGNRLQSERCFLQSKIETVFIAVCCDQSRADPLNQPCLCPFGTQFDQVEGRNFWGQVQLKEVMDQKSQITEILPKSGLVYSEKYVGFVH